MGDTWVRERWNELITGNPKTEISEYIFLKFPKHIDNPKVLSIGCGTGEKELKWASAGRFKRIDAFDLSEKRIESAREKWREYGVPSLVNFFVADASKYNFPSEEYDVVMADHSLHQLEDFLMKENEIGSDFSLFVCRKK